MPFDREREPHHTTVPTRDMRHAQPRRAEAQYAAPRSGVNDLYSDDVMFLMEFTHRYRDA